MRHWFYLSLFVMAAITTLPERSFAGQYDGVWEGEFVASIPYNCGFARRNVSLTIKNNMVSGVWKDFKKSDVNLNAELNGEEFLIIGKKWTFRAGSFGLYARNARIRGYIKNNNGSHKIITYFKIGGTHTCESKFTLSRNSAREIPDAVIALKAESGGSKLPDPGKPAVSGEDETAKLALQLKQLMKKLEEKEKQEKLNKQIAEAERKVEARRRADEEEARRKQEALRRAAEELGLKEQAERRQKQEAARKAKEAQILVASQTISTEKRVALVIGNGTYPSVGNLANPTNDARLMSQTLRQIGFEVIERIDADQKAMKKAIKAFGNKLEAAGKDSVGLFYYAGHGVQVGGSNYLIPVNVDINDEADVSIEAVSANDVQVQMAFAGSRLNIIIMDACRNNPFKRSFRAASRGLARMGATKGTLIAYATSPGAVAADGKGRNSPYTLALTKALLSPGLTVERVFKQVRNDVVVATNSKQVPWESSSLTGRDFYFKGGEAPSPHVTTAVPASQFNQKTLDLAFWDAIKNSTEAADFAAYLEQYPNGSFATLARVRQRKYAQ